MCRRSRRYIYRANGTPKLFIIHYSLLIRKAPPCAPVAFIYMTIPFRCATRHKRDMKSEYVTQHSKFCVKILLEKADTLHSTLR